MRLRENGWVYIAGGRVGQKNLVALLEDLFQNAEDLDSNW